MSVYVKLRETDLHYCIARSIKSFFGFSQAGMYFEVPVAGSRTDFLFYHVPGVHGPPPGIHAFEVKMGRDGGKKRLRRQLEDYLSAADYVWLVGVNTVIDPGFKNVGFLVYSTSSGEIFLKRHAVHDHARQDPAVRDGLLSIYQGRLKSRLKALGRMRYVEPVNGCLHVQSRL